MNDVLIRRIKFSTIAIGVRNYNKNKVDIIGSGFYYDTRGYLLSAGHVIRKARKIQKINESKNHKSEIVAINNHIPDGERLTVEADKIEETLLPSIPSTVQDPTAPVIPDVGIGKVTKGRKKYPFLKIRKVDDPIEHKLNIGDQIVLCGYPAGEQSLSFVVDKYIGLRFSAVMQFGHIAALLPFDDAIPYGIQTDILSTGGSSGSPIVSVETGEVISIAQKIILTPAMVDVPEKAQKRVRMPKQLEGFAHIGIIWGDSFNMFSDVPNMTKEDFSKGLNGLTHYTHSKAFVRPEFRTQGITLTEDDL